MAWIKRNLFFAISLFVAVLLLAAAVVYDLHSLGDNAAQKDKLTEIYGKLTQAGSGGKYGPGNEQIDNTKIAKEQTAEITDWIGKAMKYFKPIAPIPNAGEVTSEGYANALRQMIDQLQREAADAGVELPPKYGFSFEAQRSTVRYAAGSLPPLAVQLGEVKTISEILFAARVNALDGVQRARLSDDDTAGPQADYINDISTTNNLAILAPYAVTFRCFSSELAAVMAGFASSPNGFIVTGINVAPATQSAAAGNGATGMQEMPAPTTAPTPLPGKGGLQTVLNEQLLRVTLEVEIVKLSKR